MARTVNRLTARTVTALKEPGLHADGDGLYLKVDAAGAKRWVLIFHWHGKRREMGLGSASTFDLKDAREAALAARKLVARGLDPIEERKRAAGETPTFGAVADRLMESLEPTWRNAKHKAQWKTSLEEHAKALRGVKVDQIHTEDVLAVVKPIWSTIPETASRTRGRVERVLDAAKAAGWRTGENPARWRGHLALLLPRRQRLTRGHHPAMPFAELPAFYADLQTRPALAARALEFVILNASRTGEVRLADWSELDRAGKLWTIGAERMKGGKEHRVPLTDAAVAILDGLVAPGAAWPRKGLVFPGFRKARPLSDMAMTMLLRRMGIDAYSVHGFRSTFRDWAGEATGFPREIAEAALAHTVGDNVERAYRRGDALERRRKLMVAWAAYVTRAPAANVRDLATARRPAGSR